METPIRILIVEDIQSDAELVQRELLQGGVKFVARHAASREKFFSALDDELPDLVLSDFSIPGFDGMSVVREVHARSPLTPVIIVTGALTDEIAAECIKRGAFDYVLKEHLPRLVSAVHAAVEMRRLKEDERRSHEEVVRARDFYITLLDEFPNPVRRADADARTDYFNKAWLAFTGRSLDKEIGDGWTEGIHPDDLVPAVDVYLSAFERREPFFIEYRLRRANGSYHWIADNGSPICGLDGEFAGYVSSCYDVQESKEKKAKLEEQWRFLEQVLDKIDQMIYVFDHDDIVRYANETALSSRRLRRDEVIGLSLRDATWISRDYVAAYESAKSTRRPVRVDRMVVPLRDGENRIYDGWFTPFVNRDGTHGVISSIGDVTAQVAAEARQRLLSTAIEQAAETIVITDRHGTIEYVNPAFESSTGYTAAEAIGQNPNLLKSGAQDKAFYEELWKTIARGDVWSGHFMNLRKDGSVYEEAATISPVRDANETITHFVAVKRDLSREHELEQQLAQARKLDAIGRLAGGIAHDFNNLLGVISGYTEMLAKDLVEDQSARDRLAQIRKASDRAAALTRQLLAFGRRQVLKPVVVDLSVIILDTQELVRRLLRESIELVIDTAAEPAFSRVDRSQFEQVLFNLVVNARDAMPVGGTLRISTELVTVDEDSSSIGEALEPGRWVRLDVADTGVGIGQEQIAHIFEPFFTTKADGQGTGLGLATVYGIVRQSGGNILVRSLPQQGTLFRIYLPAADAGEVESAPVARPPANASKQAARTILVVEDQAMLREMIAEGLELAGARVLVAGDGEEALAVSRGFAGQIDLLLTDVVMPKISGRALAETIVTERPDLKMLFMSGYAIDVIASGGELPERVDLIQKPFTIEELLERIEYVMSTRD